MKLIALTGHMGTGKTTAREYFESQGYCSVRIKDGLINHLYEDFPMLIDKMEDAYETNVYAMCATKPRFVRELMQDYGAFKRSYDPDFFVNIYKSEVEYKITKINVVTDDIRFLNEAEVVKSLGGVIIKLTRKGCDGKNDNGVIHETEADIPLIEADYEIANDGTVEELLGKLENIWKER